MINGRNVVVSVVLLLVVSLAINAYTLLQTPDNSGAGNDSYGVRISGNRGVYDVLQEIDVPVERSHDPFDVELSPDSTLALIGPDVALLGPEKGAIQGMKDWVNNGGRLVVGFVAGWPSLGFLETFSLEEVQFVDLAEGEQLYDLEGMTDQAANIGRFIAEQRRWGEDDRALEDDLTEIMTNRLPEYTEYPVAAGMKSFPSLTDAVNLIALPKDRGIGLDVGETQPASLLNVQVDDEIRTLVAEFQHGRGSVILVSDVSLFHNYSLLQADNSVLAIQLLSEDRSGVVFDEFYHGLAIRGNPIWIFAQPGYRILTLLLLLTVGLYLWYAMPAFGTIHPPKPNHRRSLELYLDSVSRLLLKTKRQQRRLVAEAEQAFLWKMARHLQLPGERHQDQAIRVRLERRAPDELREYESVMNQFQNYRQSGCSSKELLELLQRSHRCLS